MKFRTISASCVCLISATICAAQSAPTQQSIEAKLHGAPFLMLRGMWDGEKLAFDSRGNLIGAAATVPFSMSAIELTKIEVNDAQLQIFGVRAGLEFSFNGSRVHAVVHRDHPIGVTIARDPEHPESLDAAVHKVLSVGMDDALASSAPTYWQPWLHRYLHLPSPGEQLPAGVSTMEKGFTRPLIMSGGPLQLSAGEGDSQHPAEVVVGFIIDAAGHPYDIRIVMPAGMGRDEVAVESISETRFTPVKNKQGHAVQVYLEMHMSLDRPLRPPP
jgi:hypothetical protein